MFEDGKNKTKVELFLKQYFALDDVLLTPSGKASLYYILKSSKKRTVIIPAYTCKVVTEAALLAGKEIVYWETEPKSFNSSIASISSIISSDCVVVATHQFGYPCDIQKLVEIARKNGAEIIEDVAASMGSKVDGQLTGTFGDIAFLSFDTTKLVHAPLKGGAIIASNKKLFDQVRQVYKESVLKMSAKQKAKIIFISLSLNIIEKTFLYRVFHFVFLHMKGKYSFEKNYLIKKLTNYYTVDFTDWQSSVLHKQLLNIDNIVSKRKSLHEFYRQELEECRTITLPPKLCEDWNCIRFPILINKVDKFEFYELCTKSGVDFAFSFSFIPCPKSFARSHEIARKILDIPFYLNLTYAEAKTVARIIKKLDHRIESRKTT